MHEPNHFPAVEFDPRRGEEPIYQLPDGTTRTQAAVLGLRSLANSFEVYVANLKKMMHPDLESWLDSEDRLFDPMSSFSFTHSEAFYGDELRMSFEICYEEHYPGFKLGAPRHRGITFRFRPARNLDSIQVVKDLAAALQERK